MPVQPYIVTISRVAVPSATGLSAHFNEPRRSHGLFSAHGAATARSFGIGHFPITADTSKSLSEPVGRIIRNELRIERRSITSCATAPWIGLISPSDAAPIPTRL